MRPNTRKNLPKTSKPTATPVWATTLSATSDSHENPPTPLMPRSLQAVVALFTAAGLLTVGFWFVTAGGFSGGLVPYRNSPVRLQASNPTGYSVDINTAGIVELLQLPRVGPALANRIIERREAVGPYASIDDLLAVPGIGEITLADLRPFLRPISSAAVSKASLPSAGSTDDLRTGQ